MGSLLRRQRAPDDGPADSKSGGVGCAVCRNKNNSNPAEASRPIRRSSRVAISKYSSRSSIAKRVQQRRRSRTRSCDRRRRNRSPVRKRKTRPRSCDRRRRYRSPVKKRKPRPRSCDRRRRYRSPVRKRRSRSRSYDRRTRNRSPVRKRRSRSRSYDRRTKNRSPVKKRRSRSRSYDRRRRNRSPVKKRRSRSRSYDRRRRNRSTVRKRRSCQRSALLSHLRNFTRSRRPNQRTRSISPRRKPGRPRKKSPGGPQMKPLGRPRKKPLGRPRKRSPSRPRKRSPSRPRVRPRKRSPSRPRGKPQGRPRKNPQSLVVPGSGNSLARKKDDEAQRNKSERERNEKSISKREVSTSRDAQSVFKPPDKPPRAPCDKAIDDIQENPLSSRKRRSSVVSSIPGRPFDGRKKDESRRTIPRKRQTKRRTYTRQSTKRRSNTRKSSSYKRKPSKKVSVKRTTRKPTANKNRNRNAIGSPARFSEQEVLNMQPGPGEYCRPNETNHLSTCGRPANSPKTCLSFVCPYSRRGVETTRCLRSCRCYCCRLRNCGTGSDQAGLKSPETWCTHCHRPIKFISKRRASASSRPRRVTRSGVSNLQTDISENAI